MEKAKITERELAHALCASKAQILIDEAGQLTVSGMTLGDLYFMKYCNGADLMRISAHADALRHWVVSAGYNNDNEFEYILSNTILNC